jgi:D-alanyl-D-alanine carboxypeptidase (penicillin-binding protein 5/6)
MVGRFCILVSVVLLAGCATPPPAAPAVARAERVSYPAQPPAGQPALWPQSAPAIHARHAILIDARTGRTLYQKFADASVPVASTQKLLTALVLLDGAGLDGTLVVHPVDTLVEPAKLYLRAGHVYTRRALLTAMMVESENDAALARDHSGSMEAFAAAMNRKAWTLGARNSHFANSHGLPARQHSTARDMARIAYQAYREPVLRHLMALPSYTFVYANGRTNRLKSTNKLLTRSPIYNGMKTGFTYAAGRCLISSASTGGRDVILVQLGSKSQYIFNDAERLMQWGLSQIGASW